MIHLHVFTEESSAGIVFNSLLPAILPESVTFSIYSHQGKEDLKKALTTTVPSLSKIPGARILITQDQDNDDCTLVKKELSNLLNNTCHSPYLIRVICRELESWFLGDLSALEAIFPRVRPEKYRGTQKFRNVDDIKKPSMMLLSIIPDYKGRTYLPKLELSQKIAPVLHHENNSSVSFRHVVSGIKKLIAEDFATPSTTNR